MCLPIYIYFTSRYLLRLTVLFNQTSYKTTTITTLRQKERTSVSNNNRTPITLHLISVDQDRLSETELAYRNSQSVRVDPRRTSTSALTSLLKVSTRSNSNISIKRVRRWRPSQSMTPLPKRKMIVLLKDPKKSQLPCSNVSRTTFEP